MEAPERFHLIDLPDEVLLMVIHCLDFDSLLKAVCVNRRFRELAEPFLYESITVLHGEKAVNLSHSLVKNGRRPEWVRNLLISTKFGQESALMSLPPSMCLMDNLQDLRLETPDCNNKKPEDREDWIALQDCYERIFREASVLVPDRTSRLLPNLKTCVLHFVDTHTELYSMSRYSSIFLHPTLESLTISCMSTDYPERLFKDGRDANLLKGSTNLQYLHLEECDLYPSSLELLLSFPRALKSLKISEGIRYDGIFRASSSRMHGNVKPGPFADAIVETCKDSLESLSLALGYIRSHGQNINHKGQFLKLNDLTKLTHLEVNNRTLNLIRDRQNCDHNTWKRLPASLLTFKIFNIPLLTPQQDVQQPYIPLQDCLYREKPHHGVPNLQKITYSYEHYESADDEEMNFNDLLMNLVYDQANGNPPLAPNNPNQPAAPQGNPILNLLQQAVGAVNSNQQPAPPPAPAPINTTFVTNGINPDLDGPPQHIQPPRFRWRTPSNFLPRRPVRPELSRSDTAKLSLLTTIHDSILTHFVQGQTQLQVDLVALPRGFIPPYLFPEDKPRVHEAWFDSAAAYPLTPEGFFEGIRRSREAVRSQMEARRGIRRQFRHMDGLDGERERERSRSRFMRRLRAEEEEEEAQTPDWEELAAFERERESASETGESGDEDDMQVEDMLEMLVAEAHAGAFQGVDAESEASGSVYVDASTEVEMSEVDGDNDDDEEDEEFEFFANPSVYHPRTP